MADAVEETVTEIEEGAAEAVEAATEDVVEAAQEVAEDAAEEVAATTEETVEATTEGAIEEAAEEVAAEEPVLEPEPEMPPLEPISFRGMQKIPSTAIAIFLGGIMAFSMGITNTFFAEATGWTFVIWGLLLLFSNLLDNYQTYELNNDGILITNPVRFWFRKKQWAWDDIYRLDIMTGRRDTKPEHGDMHIYHELSGEIIKDREDRKLDPEMAQIIIERAGLQPVDEANPASIAELKMNQSQQYHWSKSGAIA